MKFAPRPENDFQDYIRTYYDECRCRFGKIEAIAGKWTFRDLLPAMSDFDTRFILQDGMDADDWCEMSEAVGQAHLHLCRKHPCWIRNLEHLPGINLTWEELCSERMYYPEYRQWTFYHTENQEKLSRAKERFAARPWDIKDEYFHLKKFCLYYGRYNRTIDPAVNLGVHENKYPLHSRIMHYFNPPVMSAVCILSRKNLAGKFESFERAESLFPGLKCWAIIDEILNAHYETPKWYGEPHLSMLEDELETALKFIAGSLRDVITVVPEEAGTDIGKWKESLQNVRVDPALRVFENAKFSRLMKGRLIFYASAPEYFQTEWLISNELRRLGNNFFRVPFRTYWEIKTGKKVDDPAVIIPLLRGSVLSDSEADAVAEFARLTPGHWEHGREKEIALAIAGIFDDFFHALTRLTKDI